MRVTTTGFGPETVEAVRRYFDYYKIDANLTGAPLKQFAHPIYLQIFCNATNPDREEVKHVHLGEQTLFSIFEKYVDMSNRRIVDRLDRHPKTDLLRPALNRLARILWEENVRRISLSEAIRCIDGVPMSELASWEQSLSQAIEDEGLLLSRTWSRTEGDEEYEFAYDLMAGYFIASTIIDIFDNDLQAYLTDPDTLGILYSDGESQHPLRDDINRCLAALLPAKTGQYLHDIIEGRQEPFDYSVDALFEISPSHIDGNAVDLVERLFAKPENRSPLLDRFELTWLHKSHPLGAEFIGERLLQMNMAERDLAWSEYIRTQNGRQNTEEAVDALYKRCSDTQQSKNTKKAGCTFWPSG